MDLIVAILELLFVELLAVLAYVVVWALVIPCLLVVATPLILVVALVQAGSFRENAKRHYGVLLRQFCGMPLWMRKRLHSRRRR